MKKSSLFILLAVFFLLLGVSFGYAYLTSAQEKSDISKLLLGLSNLVLAGAMFLFSRNKAFKE